MNLGNRIHPQDNAIGARSFKKTWSRRSFSNILQGSSDPFFVQLGNDPELIEKEEFVPMHSRRPATAGARRAARALKADVRNADIRLRGPRGSLSSEAFPSEWDDRIPAAVKDRCWKGFRRTRWRTQA